MPKSQLPQRKRRPVRSVPQKKGYSRKSPTGAALYALQLTKDQPQISLRQACRTVSSENRLNCGSVWRAMIRFRRRAREGTRRDPRWKLTQEEEETVVGMVLAFDHASMPLKVRQMRDAIQHVYHVKVSATWISEFKQRHEQYLRTRTTKGIETRRLKTT